MHKIELRPVKGEVPLTSLRLAVISATDSSFPIFVAICHRPIIELLDFAQSPRSSKYSSRPRDFARPAHGINTNLQRNRFSRSKKHNCIQLKVHPQLLTDDVELDEEAPDWLRADLALVAARVAAARPLDLEHPLVARRVVVRLVPRVRRVREATHRQDVQVAVTDPRHLQWGS